MHIRCNAALQQKKKQDNELALVAASDSDLKKMEMSGKSNLMMMDKAQVVMAEKMKRKFFTNKHCQSMLAIFKNNNNYKKVKAIWPVDCAITFTMQIHTET